VRVFGADSNRAAAEEIRLAARLLGGPLTSAATGAGARAASGGPDPVNFPKKGSPINNNRSWEMEFMVEGGPCGSNDSTLSDRITMTLIVDPDSRQSRFSGQNIFYFPDGRHYTGVHFENWVLCYGYERVCGNSNRNLSVRTGKKKNVWYLESDVPLNGHDSTHAFAFWAYFKPHGKWDVDEGKTNSAACPPKPSNRNLACIY
jgi:hypothetical protein